MSLSDYAKVKAREFAKAIIEQADSSTRTDVGGVRQLFIYPFSLIYAGLFQDIEVARAFYLGNYAALSEGDMDTLAGNLLLERPQGSRSSTNLRVYTEEITPFNLDVYPYFFTDSGIAFSPAQAIGFVEGDFLEDNGEYYVNVPVVSEALDEDTTVLAGDISGFTQMPVDVRYVTNISDTVGGDGRPDNEAFFTYIQNAINDGTLNEIGGVKKYIADNYPDALEVLVVSAGDPKLIRDEVWTSDGINPNFSRDGVPFNTHTNIGSLDFDTVYGLAYSATGAFPADSEGKRIALTGDEEDFRKILKRVDANTAKLSGYQLEGAFNGTVWEEGPKFLQTADVYMYYQNLQINTATIDKRYFLEAAQATTASTRIYYNQASGFSYASIPSSGRIVIAEGTTSEQSATVIAEGTDGTGPYVDVDQNITVPGGSAMSLYDMSEIVIGEDIEARPVIYVLQVDRLDPLSFEVEETVPQSRPGIYAEPGWYISETDPAEVFSARESKKIKLAAKRGSLGYGELNITTNQIIDSTSKLIGTAAAVTTGINHIQKSGYDFTGLEGRDVTVQRPEFTLDDETKNVTGAAILSGAGSDEIIVNGFDVDIMSNIGYRDDVKVVVKDGGAATILTINPGDAYVYGNRVKVKSGVIPGTAATADLYVPKIDQLPILASAGDLTWSVDRILYEHNGTNWIEYTSPVDTSPYVPLLDVDGIVAAGTSALYPAGSPTERIELVTSEHLPLRLEVSDPTQIIVYFRTAEAASTSIVADSEEGLFDQSPVRVVYATHSDIAAIQTEFDDGENQLLCKDTLARAFFPTLIDATIRFSGRASSEQMHDRFVSLISSAVTTSEDSNGDIRLDMSNIIAALDEEGLSDSIDVNFEIRVTNFLDDGEFETRYINPSEATNQALAMDATTSSGARHITLRRLNSTAAIPSRGVLRLGGNNPSIQESLPYEAVIDNLDDTYRFVLRAGFTTSHTHNEWETSFVSVRDFEPSLEYTDGAIFIPKNNRPYVRQLVVIKEA